MVIRKEAADVSTSDGLTMMLAERKLRIEQHRKKKDKLEFQQDPVSVAMVEYHELMIERVQDEITLINEIRISRK